MNAPIVLLLDSISLDRHSIRSLVTAIDSRLVVRTASSMAEINSLISVHNQAPQLAILELQSTQGSHDLELDTFQHNYPHIPVLVTRDKTTEGATSADQPEGTLGLIHKDAEARDIAQCIAQALALSQKGVMSHKALIVKRPGGEDAAAIPALDTDAAFYASHGFLDPEHKEQEIAGGLEVPDLTQDAMLLAREYFDGRHLGLTARQRDVLQLIMHGMSNKAICRFLNLAEGTTKVHVSAVLKSLRVSSRTQVAMAALRAGIRIKPLQLMKDLKAISEAKSLEDLKKIPLRRVLDAQKELYSLKTPKDQKK